MDVGIFLYFKNGRFLGVVFIGLCDKVLEFYLIILSILIFFEIELCDSICRYVLL